MNYNAAMFWMNFILAVINLLGVGYVWWTNREKVTTTKFEELKAHINRLEKSLEKGGGQNQGLAQFVPITPAWKPMTSS